MFAKNQLNLIAIAFQRLLCFCDQTINLNRNNKYKFQYVCAHNMQKRHIIIFAPGQKKEKVLLSLFFSIIN